MSDVLIIFKTEAKAITSLELRTSFKRDLAPELGYCGENFFHNRVMSKLRQEVLGMLGDDYGFGLDHSKRVAIEAGAIVLRECGGNTVLGRKLALLAQVAGLLHDICRGEADHAAKGAELCRSILANYQLSEEEIEEVSLAIAMHEDESGAPSGHLVADALYDADKLRWGLDIYTTTLWETCDYCEWPLETILGKYESCINGVTRYSGSFRTNVGRRYGPELIAQAPQLGQIMYEKLQRCVSGE